jgi:hypothetical protein
MKRERDSDVLVEDEQDLNRDPITGAPGSHPVGTGAGAVGGAAAGAAAGTAVGGPVGGVGGGAVGAVAGGAAGHAVAESIDPTVEDAYWRETYATRDYIEAGRPYEDYQPAYRYGWESRATRPGRAWNEVEGDLERGWNEFKGDSRLSWNQAKNATRDAWHRVERALPGDADNDGR